MAFVTFPDHGTLVVTVQGNDGAHTWRNSQDLVWTTGDGPPAPGDAVVQAWVNFIKNATRNDAKIIQYSLRNWSRGDVPFSEQAAIWVQHVSIPCQDFGAGNAYSGATSSDAVPLGEVAILLVKQPFASAGKPGHNFLKNSIHGNWISSDTGGPPVLTGAGVGADAEFNTYAHTRLDAYCEDNPLPRFCIVHYSKKEGTFFEGAMVAPQFERLTTHNIGKH